MIAALALWGCGSDNNGAGPTDGGGHDGGGAGGHAGSSAGGRGGSTAGTTGSAGAEAGSTGTAGNTAGATGTAGNTAGSTGTAGNTAGSTGTAGNTAGATGTAGNTAGSTGTAGATAGSTGTAGNTAGSTGTAGATAGNTGTAGATAGNTGTAGAAAGNTGTAGATAGNTGTAGATAGSGGGGAGGTTPTCSAATECTGANANKVCKNGGCSACASDGECQSTTTGYGAKHLCQNGVCVSGDCRSTADTTMTPTCAASNLVCVSMSCTTCSADTDCAAYGANHICLGGQSGGQCIPGNCKSTTGTPGCTATKQICDLTTTHSCVNCASDTQCQDAANYGAGSYCEGNVCTPGQCRNATDCSGGNLGKLCNSSLQCYACTSTSECTAAAAYGPNHVCFQGACVSGSCLSTADCTGSNQICDTGTHTCKSCQLDTECTTDYGPVHICLKDSNGQNGVCVAGDCHDTSAECKSANQICGGSGVPHTCGGCASDGACTSDTTNYGSTYICLNPGATGTCVVGDCHDTSSQCTLGKVCGPSPAHTCQSCGSGAAGDTQCANDARYGTGNICYQGSCTPGNCHATSSECATGLICGVTTTNTCGSCTSDTQCKSDPIYGSSTICNTATGKCVSNVCSTNSTTCSANSSDFCCGSACVAGNCCGDSDCVSNPSFGAGYACVGNSCSQCNPASGNKYYVDPVNGNDQTATGSGLSGGNATPSCSFKTIARAIQVIGSSAPANTKLILVGVAGQSRTISDTLPITLPSNVTLTTMTGPFKITLANVATTSPAGFRLLNAGSGITSDAAAPLTLDGNNHASGIAIQVAPGSGNSVSLSNVTIQNTGGNGITVASGTLNIGGGVVVTGAGVSPGATRDGIAISGGVANINVPAGQTPTSFNNNTLAGIDVTALGSVNITGAPTSAPTSAGTVVTNGNTSAGLRINQTVGTGPLSTINGLVAWANQNYGARIYGGSKVKVRNSVFGSNAIDGILVQNANGTAAGNDLSNIDLGVSGDPGMNWLQTPLGALGTNLTTGLCVAMSQNQGALTLNARGNELVTTGSAQVDCSLAAGGTITKAGTCQNHNSVGGSTAAAGTTVTIDVSTCN